MKKGITKKSTIIFVFIMALFLYIGSAHAYSGILNNFNSTYPGSSSGANANCMLCHGEGTWDGDLDLLPRVRSKEFHILGLHRVPSAYPSRNARNRIRVAGPVQG